MELLNRSELQSRINFMAQSGVEFLFLIDFKGESGYVLRLDELQNEGVYCCVNGVELGKRASLKSDFAQEIGTAPISFAQYNDAFDKVTYHINHGDSYLLNLTMPTKLIGQIDMQSVYYSSVARYKFMVENQFLFYSPESFVKISGGEIFSFPMKGTISAACEDAASQLIDSNKELREHYTIVDLIRNDLSMVSYDVKVDNFRYIERINTAFGAILQTSSCISGRLKSDWQSKLGDILLTLLPAGSVSGAPKERSVEIIESVELCDRGFYTGIMGVFKDGVVDSCVNIRYLERRDDGFYYRSGGGITSLSDAKDEYDELLTKIYVPIV